MAVENRWEGGPLVGALYLSLGPVTTLSQSAWTVKGPPRPGGGAMIGLRHFFCRTHALPEGEEGGGKEARGTEFTGDKYCCQRAINDPDGESRQVALLDE